MFVEKSNNFYPKPSHIKKTKEYYYTKESDSLEKSGLTNEEVEKSREQHGENKLQEYKRKSFFKCFLANLGDPIIKVLIGALFINIIFMFPNINWFESGGILCSIITATVVSTFSEYSSENTFERLRKENENVVSIVKRAEGVCEIPSQEVVVGDICIVDAGTRVAADGVVLTGEAYADESALTGESREVNKKAGDKVFKGSLILSGGCEMQVEAVGQSTYYGTVAKELMSDTRPSPLKKRLSQLAKSISAIGYLAALVIALAYLFNVFFIDTGFDVSKTLAMVSDVKLLVSKLLYALTLAVSIVVVAVPEGLPMMITVVLSSNMKKMARDSVLVRKPVGIETSGNISLLFTDKTGTLTEGKLRVKEIHSACGNVYGSLSSLKKSPKYGKMVTLCASLCNSATLKGKTAIGGDATDRCLKEFFSQYSNEVQISYRIPFDSAKKYSAVGIVGEGGELTLFKGSPERLISSAESYLDSEGQKRPLKGEALCRLQACLSKLTSQAYRVVALGYKAGKEVEPNGIVFVSLVAIRDKIRKEVPRAIAEVQGAGVGVIMITGDNRETARAIAKECGIISPYSKRDLVINGTELKEMDDNALGSLLPRIAVIARALPSDKSRLVRIAQESGYVVGMTGDGINDAPSLKAADVGFGMGSGTEVAKEACDIVIGDNSFKSIVKAILYGRTIFESIRKFIVFQLTMNFAAVGISLLGPFIGVDSPVTVTQMLWVNIIMDTLGALAFAKEPHLAEYMKNKPRQMNEKIISRDMVKQIASTALYVLALCVWFLKSPTLSMLMMRGDEEYILSAFFAMFIFTGVFACFTARTGRLNILANIGKNKSFMLIMAGVSVMQTAFIYFGGSVFRTVPLAYGDLIRVILISFTVVVFDFMRKLMKKLFIGGKRKCQRENTCMRVS